MTLPYTRSDVLTVIQLLLKGRGFNFIADASPGLSLEKVKEIAMQHGWPEVDKLQEALQRVDAEEEPLPRTEHRTAPRSHPRPAPIADTTPVPQLPPKIVTPAQVKRDEEAARPSQPKAWDRSVDTLVEKGLASKSKATQRLAERVRDLHRNLVIQLHEEERMEAERRQREEEKAKAKAEVERLQRELTAARAKLGRKPKASKPKNPENAKIREWAREQGLDCPERGRIPADIRTAYEEAHA